MERDQKLDVTNYFGFTALHLCSLFSQTEGIRFLYDHNVDMTCTITKNKLHSFINSSGSKYAPSNLVAPVFANDSLEGMCRGSAAFSCSSADMCLADSLPRMDSEDILSSIYSQMHCNGNNGYHCDQNLPLHTTNLYEETSGCPQGQEFCGTPDFGCDLCTGYMRALQENTDGSAIIEHYKLSNYTAFQLALYAVQLRSVQTLLDLKVKCNCKKSEESSLLYASILSFSILTYINTEVLTSYHATLSKKMTEYNSFVPSELLNALYFCILQRDLLALSHLIKNTIDIDSELPVKESIRPIQIACAFLDVSMLSLLIGMLSSVHGHSL